MNRVNAPSVSKMDAGYGPLCRGYPEIFRRLLFLSESALGREANDDKVAGPGGNYYYRFGDCERG